MRGLITGFALVVVVVAACSDFNTPSQGERCNPNRIGTDDPNRLECASGLVCVTPDNCSQAYCCPANPIALQPGMLNANCMACAAPVDAGAE